MIGYLKGQAVHISEERVIISVKGVGFEVNMAPIALSAMQKDSEVAVFVSESISPYDGTVLYGFNTMEEKELFLLFREAIPNTGAKKSLEYLNKALKSLPDFQKAIINRDTKLLTGIFGFTEKTAQKLISFLKDKMPENAGTGEGKLRIMDNLSTTSAASQVLRALIALGYTTSEASKVLQSIQAEDSSPLSVEETIRIALRKLSV